LEAKYLEKIFDALHKKFAFAENIEITIEANP
jgi:coproporphyrinogen III oxidase-like Fe-S oxidoreductase